LMALLVCSSHAALITMSPAETVTREEAVDPLSLHHHCIPEGPG
jgi:hypothetical protein